jgi:uroporphyrinogen decarboxylase
MTGNQWQILLDTVRGKRPEQPVTGFIIDSPWLPGWAGVTTLQYFTSEEIWFQTNRKAVEAFPDITFLPGFWSEFGMCSEPSAFGARMIWNEYNLPHAERIITDISEAASLKIPNPRTDGLLPFIVQRLANYRQPMEAMGHEI